MSNEPFYPAATSSKGIVLKGTVKLYGCCLLSPGISVVCVPPWFDRLLWKLYFCLFVLVGNFHGEVLFFKAVYKHKIC